jgi:uncharacterized SAM-binding protein YcdF (DUF218 family)
MFFLKKLIAPFVLPGGLLVLALAGGALYFWRRCRPAACYLTALAALVWLGSSSLAGDLLLRPLESAYEQPAAPEGDVIIVLSGGSSDGAGAVSAGEYLHTPSLERCSAAAALWRRTRLPLLLTGGRLATRRSEAEAQADYLAELGVPRQAMTLETESRDTNESAALSYRLCRERGWSRPILLSSASHLPRSVLAFRKAGFGELTPFPVARVSGRGRLRLNGLLPGTFQPQARAFNEYFGLLFYALAY